MTRVAVVGGGIAGLTAALRLAERRYDVTLYEQQPTLGGNLSSQKAPGDGPEDVYPHMYLNWYHNFWDLLGDVTNGKPIDEMFAARDSVKQLSRGDYPNFKALTNFYSYRYALRNLFSGILPPADEFLFVYASVDLLATRLRSVLLDEVSVNGFLRSRPYITERAAQAFDSWITRVWAVPSYLASAADYQTFLKHGFDEPVPSLRLVAGPAQDIVIAPLDAALRKAGATINTSTSVVSVACTADTVDTIEVSQNGTVRTEAVDDLVVAVPPPALAQLIRAGPAGGRIIDAVPDLAEIDRLHTETIPIVHLYFKRRLSKIPPEPVGLVGARYGLAFTDISQSRPDISPNNDYTVLALSASDRYGLPGTGPEANAMTMIRELSQYVTDFTVGTSWGDSADIDWVKTTYNDNLDTRLFVNQTGSEQARPPTHFPHLGNLYFAGDFCRHDIGMSCIEAAVVSGLEAVRSVVDRRGVGKHVDIKKPKDPPLAFFAWLRAAWAPYAAAAKTWSSGSDMLGGATRRLR